MSWCKHFLKDKGKHCFSGTNGLFPSLFCVSFGCFVTIIDYVSLGFGKLFSSPAWSHKQKGFQLLNYIVWMFNKTTSHVGTIGSFHREPQWTYPFFSQTDSKHNICCNFWSHFNFCNLRCTKRENIWSEKGYLSETTLSPQKRAKSLLDTVSPTFHNGNLVERRGTTIPTATPTELSVFCLGYILSLYM